MVTYKLSSLSSKFHQSSFENNPKFRLFHHFTKIQVSCYYGYAPNLHASSKSIRTVDQSCNHFCSQRGQFSIIFEFQFRLNSSFLSLKKSKVRASKTCSSKYIIEKKQKNTLKQVHMTPTRQPPSTRTLNNTW
jgi:hypothetical protein